MLSLYLPHVYSQFNEKFIVNIFENIHKFGKVTRVDIVSNQPIYNSVYVHFQFWNTEQWHVREFQELIMDNKTVQIVYQGKYYWNVLLNTSKGKQNIVNKRNECVDINSKVSKEPGENEVTMKSNKFFSDLVKNRTIDCSKKADNFVAVFTSQDLSNIEEIEAALEEEYYAEIFMDEIERFDECYFN
jgi:hypothetical protein